MKVNRLSVDTYTELSKDFIVASKNVLKNQENRA